MGFPIKPKDILSHNKNQVRRSILGGMMAGETPGDALKNAAVNGLDPYQMYINKNNKRDLPEWGDPPEDVKKAREEKERKRKERFAQLGMTPPTGMKKGGQVKAAAKPQKMNCGGTVKKMSDGGLTGTYPSRGRAPITDRKVGTQTLKKGGQAKAGGCRGMGAATKGGKFSRSG